MTSRDERQEKGIEKWRKARGKGTIQGVTGFGKTRTGAKAAKRMQDYRGGRLLVVIPLVQLKSQWEEELKEQGVENFEVLTIQSVLSRVKKARATFFNAELLILDEYHSFGSRKYRIIFDITNYKFILGLTPYLTRRDSGELSFLQKKAPVIDTIGMGEALSKGYVSPFRVYNVPISLGETEEEHDKYQDIFKSTFSKFNWDFKTMIRCSFGKEKGGDKYCLWFAQSMGWRADLPNSDKHKWHPKRVSTLANQAMWSMRARRMLLANHPYKVEAVKRIVENSPEVPTLIFSLSVKQSDAVAEIINETGRHAEAYHYKIPKKDSKNLEERKKEIINMFKTGKINYLSCIDSLSQGFNYENISMGIATGGNSTLIQEIQKIGRVIRTKEGKQAIFINLFMCHSDGKKTQDRRWLEGRQRKVVNVKWLNNLEEMIEILKNENRKIHSPPDKIPD